MKTGWGGPKDQYGLAVVEFALVAALIFLPLFLGVIDVGMRYYQHNTLAKAVHDAARYYAMTCNGEGHGDNSSGAYGGALAILTANISGLQVKQGGVLGSPDLDYVSNLTTVNGLKEDLSACFQQADSCNPGCVYIEFQSPKPGSKYVFGTWEDTRTITSLQRVMR